MLPAAWTTSLKTRFKTFLFRSLTDVIDMHERGWTLFDINLIIRPRPQILLICCWYCCLHQGRKFVKMFRFGKVRRPRKNNWRTRWAGTSWQGFTFFLTINPIKSKYRQFEVISTFPRLQMQYWNIMKGPWDRWDLTYLSFHTITYLSFHTMYIVRWANISWFQVVT